MGTPLVAVVCYHLPAGRVTRWRGGAYAIPDVYVAALRRAGARPVLLPGPETSPPDDVLTPFDGLLLAGGGDVDPARYGGEPHPNLAGVDPDRDQIEVDLVRGAAAGGRPVLAVCRGFQVLNVAFGGTLRPHLPDVAGLARHAPGGEGSEPVLHEVKVAESSRLFSAVGRPAVTGFSSHHQGVERIGRGLTPVAWTGDGLVEAVEAVEGWVLGVQWHPEETAGRDPAQQALFEAFAEQARGHAGD